MEPPQERDFILRVIEYGLKKKSFTCNEVTTNVAREAYEHTFVTNVLFARSSKEITPNSVFCVTLESSSPYDQPCMILPNALFSYIDHLEIVEARKAALESKRLAWIAIWISTGIGLISLIIGTLQIYFQLNQMN